MKTIDVNNWDLFSERAYSRSYMSKDGLFMLKTVNADDQSAAAYLKEEYDVDCIANQLGIPTAKVYDFVKTTNNEVGIIFDYIKDKISCSRAISQEPERLEEYVKLFTASVKKMHSIEANTSLIPSFTSRVFSGLDATRIFNDKEKALLKERLLKLPSDNKCLHGDLTLSNVVHSPSGDYIIDLGNLSYGSPMYDVAFFYYLTMFLPEDLPQKFFHFDMSTLKKCWEVYAKEYFGSNDLREIEEYLKPYAKFAGLPVLNVANDIPSVIAAKDFILSE